MGVQARGGRRRALGWWCLAVGLLSSALVTPGAAAKAGGRASRLPRATVGEQYAEQLSSGGGAPPYRFALTAGALPAGVQLSESGELAGVPTEARGFSFQVSASDSSDPVGTQTRSYTLTVALALGPASLPAGEVGVPYGPGGAGVAIEAFGGVPPYTFEFFVPIPSASQGLTLAEDGLISGTPEEPGVLRVEVVASSAASHAVGSRVYRIRIKGSRNGLLPGPWLLEYSFFDQLEPIFFDSIATEADGGLDDEHDHPGTWHYHAGSLSFTLEVAPGVLNEYVGRGIAPVGPFTGTWHNGEWAFRLIRE